LTLLFDPLVPQASVSLFNHPSEKSMTLCYILENSLEKKGTHPFDD
jgi:hypothetical protein